MPTHDKPQGSESITENTDNHEKRTARIRELMSAGLSQSDAELIDDQTKEVVAETFAVHERYLVEMQRRHPDITMAFAAHSVSCMCANWEESRKSLLREMGIVFIDSPEQFEALLREIFGDRRR